MANNRGSTSVEAAMSPAILGRAQRTGLAPRRRDATGFTLAELLVSIGVLVLLVFLATQLLNNVAGITTIGHKQMDADAQARQLLDRMAIDFAQMVKRSDVDYYVKSSATGAGVRNLLQPGNDKIAFYSAVPGYYLSGSTSTQQSPVSLVSYRVNAQHKLERMGKGLVWNAISTTDTPVVFMPIPLASPIPVGELPSPTPNPLPTPAWPNIDNLSVSPTPDPNTEVVGSQVFRFEYYYLVQGQVPAGAIPSPAPSPSPPILSDIPWDTRICLCPPSPTPTATPTPTITPPALCCHTAPEGMQDVVAVVVDIAVIDSKSRALVTDAQLARLNGADGQPPALEDYDYTAETMPGQLLARWRAALDANAIGLPRPAISGIRLYERYLYLSPPTLQTP
jgi:type II secretion system protein J